MCDQTAKFLFELYSLLNLNLTSTNRILSAQVRRLQAEKKEACLMLDKLKQQSRQKIKELSQKFKQQLQELLMNDSNLYSQQQIKEKVEKMISIQECELLRTRVAELQSELAVAMTSSQQRIFDLQFQRQADIKIMQQLQKRIAVSDVERDSAKFQLVLKKQELKANNQKIESLQSINAKLISSLRPSKQTHKTQAFRKQKSSKSVKIVEQVSGFQQKEEGKARRQSLLSLKSMISILVQKDSQFQSICDNQFLQDQKLQEFINGNDLKGHQPTRYLFILSKVLQIDQVSKLVNFLVRLIKNFIALGQRVLGFNQERSYQRIKMTWRFIKSNLQKI